MSFASFSRHCLLIALFLGAPLSRLSAATTIKMGTLAPVGSSFHKILMTMGESWKRDSKGAVELRLYAGGKAGGEAEMVGLMMENSLQASLLTAVGLAEIDMAAKGAQSLPMAYNNLDEVDYVGEQLHPMLEQILDKKGFVVLFWSDVGWIHFYSNKPVMVPDDLRKLRLFTWAGDITQMEIVKAAGFNLVPIETADIVPSLQTGLIDAVPMPSFYAMASQVDRRAPYMLDLNYSPLVGGCVITKAAWQAIPAEVRPAILAAGRLAGQEIKAAGRRESTEAEAAMVKRGLKITHPTPEVVEEWRKMAESQYPKIRGQMVPPEVFDKAISSLKEFRAKGNP